MHPTCKHLIAKWFSAEQMKEKLSGNWLNETHLANDY